MFSVVIPTFNEGERLKHTVESILATATEHVEIVIIDDASTDGSAERLDALSWRLHGVRVYRNAQRSGVAASRANGMDLATGDWLLCIDAHNRFPDNWQNAIEEAVDALDGGYGYLLGPELHYGDYHITGLVHPEPDLYGHQLARQPGPMPYRSMTLPGACHIIRRDWYVETGGYDRNMLPPWGGEDFEYSLRCWMLGGECRVIPDMEMTTHFATEWKYPMTFSITIGNVLRVAQIYLDDDRLAQYISTQDAHPEFPDALRRAIASGSQERRCELQARFARTLDELFEIFGVDW